MKKMTLALCVSAVAISMSVSGAYAKSEKASPKAANGQAEVSKGQTLSAENCSATVNRDNGTPQGDDNTVASGGNTNDPKTLATHVANCDQWWKEIGYI
ncbi:MAG: hypothetical protein KAJ19_28720 [Gammaproteobacteria bacterium]|nr:hypothetical protein [Gammaproteobacteria bacterium]